MLGLVLVVVIGVAIVGCTLAGRRLGIGAPVLLLCAGVSLGLIPALGGVRLPPQVVLLLFLPVLLYWECLTTSLREIRRMLRGIVLASTLLVAVTAGSVAAVGHALGLGWGPAWVLGAALAPTDATVVAALAGMLPRRSLIALQAESLVNDGTALVIYGIALGVAAGAQQLTFPHVAWLFVLSYVGGVAMGTAVAYLGVRIRARLQDPLLASTVIILIPFTAYLGADAIHASGVLAVVTCGLISSQAGPRIGLAGARRQTQEAWSLATFLLNGALFVLVGLAAPNAVRGLTSATPGSALVLVAVLSLLLVAVRAAFLFASAYTIRALDRRPSQRLRRMSNRSRIVSALAGFRGAVSLAAALGVPGTVEGGGPFPARDEIVFVTFGVIAVLLVGQSALLPRVVRWARLPADATAAQEAHLAETTVTEQALEALDEIAAEAGVQEAAVIDRARAEMRKHLRLAHAPDGGDESEDAAARRYLEQNRALRLAVVAHKRATLIRLRDENRIDDIALRAVQARLDNEEVRLQPLGPFT